MTHIYVGKPTIIGSDNGFSPERHQDIIWTNDVILLIGPLGTKCSEILIEIQTIFIDENTFENVACEMLFISSRPQCVNILYTKLYVVPVMYRPFGCVLYAYNRSDNQMSNIIVTMIFISRLQYRCKWHPIALSANCCDKNCYDSSG